MAKKQSPGKKPAKTEDEDTQEGTEGSEGSDDNDEDGEDDNRRINAIVTSRVKREMKQVNATLQAMQETLKALSTPKKDEESDDEDDEDTTEGTEKKEPKVDPKLSRKMTKLERELADEKAARKQAEKERAEEQERGKRTEMRNAFSSVLTELGVTDPKLLRAAINVLEEDGVMIRDEDGKIKFKGVDKYGIETNFDPKAGLKAWVAGDGKSFVPAVDAGGSGTGPARGTGNGTTPLTPREFKKLSAYEQASINLERACSGQPPLDTGE